MSEESTTSEEKDEEFNRRFLLQRIPGHFQALFTELPLLEDENFTIFFREVIECIDTVKPIDSHEWFWVRDISLLNWNIRRIRVFQIEIIQIARHTAVAPANSAHASKNTEAWEDKAVKELIERYQILDRIIASYESRRDRIIRGLERRRKRLARQQSEASAKVIERYFQTAKIGGVRFGS